MTPRKNPASQGTAAPAARNASPAGARRTPTPSVAATRLAHALDALLEEGLTHYDDLTAAGRRRMRELNAGFAAGEAVLARVRRRGTAALPPVERVRLLADVVRFILHWAGEERDMPEPPETLAALRAMRRALEAASGTLAADPSGDVSRPMRGRSAS